jgi:hypothetical protein
MKKNFIENLIGSNQKWAIKLEFSFENLIQVKKILFREDISMKEFFSFVSYMIEHNQKYHEIYQLIIKEIKALKANNELNLLDSLNGGKKNIYSILNSANAFKNRKDNYNSDEEKNNNQKNKDSQENNISEANYQKYISVIEKYKLKKDLE